MLFRSAGICKLSIRFRSERKKWQVGATINGKRIRMLFDTKREAQDVDADLRLKKLGFAGKENSKYSIKEAFANYLSTESQQKSPASQKCDARLLDMALHHLSSNGKLYAGDVGLEDLQLFQIQAQKTSDWSATTTAHRMKILKAVFNKLFITGRISKNPAEHWKVPTGESEKRRPMTGAEFEKIYALASKRERAVLLIMMATGMRGVSIASLTWGDVDLLNGRLSAKSRKGGRGKMKTILIPMIAELRDMLTQTWNEQRPSDPTVHVFLNDKDEPFSAHAISMMGCRLIKEAGLHGVVLYGLRHKMATDLIEAGVSGEIARRIMGHASEKQLQEYTSRITMEPLQTALTLIRSKKDGTTGTE